jgi:hypothetical protein
MSFFEIEPMGAKHYGGIAVGGRLGGKGRGVRKIGMRGMGMPVGGMPVGGMPVGGAMMRMQTMGGIPVGGMSYGDMYDTEGLYDTMGGRGNAVGASKNAWLKHVAMVRQKNPKATLKQISQDYKKRTPVARGKATSAPSKPVLLKSLMEILRHLSKEQLIQVGALLTSSGFGMMHGGAWYDDLLSGVQTGVQLASQIAPLLAMV